MIKIRKLMMMAAAAAAVTGAVVFAPATAAPATPAQAAAASVTKPAAPAATGATEKSPGLTRQSAHLLPKPHHVAWKKLKRNRAMDWAESMTGHPYEWGGTGPGFDCSGLVMMAYEHVGIYLPRTTYGMLASPRIERVSVPARGDLAFYSSGHVELVTRNWRRYTFGAHDSGTLVSRIRYWPGSWAPTAFYRVKGAG